MSERKGGRTVSDAELVQFLDGEITGHARERLAARIAAEPASAARLEALRGHAARVSDWVGALDPGKGEIQRVAKELREALVPRNLDPPRQPLGWRTMPRFLHATTPLLRAAAVVLLLAGAAFAVPPARRWILTRVERITETMRGASDEVAPPIPTPIPEPEPDVRFTFAVTGPRFDVQVTGAPEGRLELRSTTEATASIEVHGGPRASVTYLPDGLRIESAGESDAVFAVRLPRQVTLANVRVGDSNAVAHALPSDTTAIVIQLRGR